jgi:TonB family protein
MEAFALYLFKSVIWLTSFAVIYFLFLRNERFFKLKRFYLISGILISIFFPLVTVHYQVDLPAPVVNQNDFVPNENSMYSPVQQLNLGKPFSFRYIFLLFYLSGVLFFAFRSIWNIRPIYSTIKKATINNIKSVKLIRASEFSSSFSFFNYIFINPSLSEDEAAEILNHELVHVHQKHWFDLLIVELLQLIQWANPFVWIYTGFIRLNHEYIADETALELTNDPAIYKAVLMNQMYRAKVFNLSNSFDYSFNKNRFEMMKKIITSPYRKLKVLFVLPIVAIVFYAFASPEYHYLSPISKPLSENQTSINNDGAVNVVVLKEDNTPFAGVSIVITETYARGMTDDSGNFTINNVPDGAFLVISQAGYKTQFVKANFTAKMTITLMKDPDYDRLMVIRGNYIGGSPSPLVIIDGEITDKGLKDIRADEIARLTVLKGKDATDKYGEKGKDGVVEILTIKKAKELNIKVPFKRHDPIDYPTFKGEARFAFDEWVVSQVKYPPEALDKGIQGRVEVSFTVELDGSLSNVKTVRSPDPILANEILNVVKSSPKWDPPKNQAVDESLQYSITVKFELPHKISSSKAFVAVEEMPEYPGGDMALLKFIAENTKYPEAALKEKIQGRVILRFIVTKEGKTDDITVLKGVNPILDSAAVQVASLISGWKPGRQGGLSVDVYYMVPITFTLP